jgi:hypothetical protein
MFATSIILMFLFATTSCNEPSLIGADVIDTDRPDVLSTDTLTLFSSSVKDDSIRTYNGLSLLPTYLCGILEDPIFGKSTSEINAQLRVAGSAPDTTFFQNISSGMTQLDSVVFILEYDQDKFFGNDITQQDVSVYRLDESMSNLETYYSNDSFLAGNKIFSGTINPSQFDSLTVIGGDTVRVPLMRLVLDKAEALALPLFSDILFKDFSSYQYYESDDTLLQVLNGVKVLVENSTTTKDLMMAFKLSTSSVSGMFLHYHSATDTSLYRFRFTSNGAQMARFEHDYTGSPVEPFIDGIDDEIDGGEEFIFIQGMQGLNGKIRIPYTSGLKNPIINQAQLKLTLATMVPDDVTFYRDNPLEQLFLSKKNADGELIIIADLNTAIEVGSLTGFFGGNLVEKTENNIVISTYTMNISEHLQDIINGVETSDEIFISTISKAQSANRSIIFGTGHPTYAPRLNVTYTINQ